MLWFTFSTAEAQTPEPPPEPTAEVQLPDTHIVQDGETLFTIAEQYGTTIESLQLLNNIDDPSLIFVGQALTLPGAIGDSVTTIHTVQLGDSLEGLAAAYKTSPTDIAAVNWMIYGENLAAGKPIVILSKTGSSFPEILAASAHIVTPGESLLTIAAEYGLAPMQIAAANELPKPAYLFPGQRLKIPNEGAYQHLPGLFSHVALYPLPIYQGESAAVYVEGIGEGFVPAGNMGDQQLVFAPINDGFIALIGIDAFTEPGYHTVSLTDENSDTMTFSQEVIINNSGFGVQSITVPADKEHLLEPEVRQNEDASLAAIYSSFESEPSWEELFTLPVSNTLITAGYGDARSYNDGPIEIYHSGVDFGGGIGTEIQAPAPGMVVLSETLTLRGNSLIINHGLGIMTGYYHLSNILVEEGEAVSAGQVIAEGGSTGLSTGPHLHWDLRVHNVPVNPLQWTTTDFLGPTSKRIE